MPLYECQCERCEFTFEVLAPISEAATKSHPCPECGRQARRIISWVSFGRGGKSTPEQPSISEPSRNDVTQLKVPAPMQICWMDKPSSARYAAHMHGRGAEYDETVAARTDRRKQRGETTDKPATASHQHSHSPLSDPAVFARRRKAASNAKKVSPPK